MGTTASESTGKTQRGPTATTYHAFISYSHASERQFARILQLTLQRFANPWHRRRAVRIFRDESDLAADRGLWPRIQSAMDASAYCLLLASPEAAASEWVAKEVDYWCQTKGMEKLLIVLVAGEIAWDAASNDFDWEQTTSLPICLQQRFAQEPIHVDFRGFRRRTAMRYLRGPRAALLHRFPSELASLAAPLRGQEKAELYADDLQQQRRLLRLVGSLLLLTLVAFATTLWFWRGEAMARTAAENTRLDELHTTAREARLRGDWQIAIPAYDRLIAHKLVDPFERLILGVERIRGRFATAQRGDLASDLQELLDRHQRLSRQPLPNSVDTGQWERARVTLRLFQGDVELTESVGSRDGLSFLQEAVQGDLARADRLYAEGLLAHDASASLAKFSEAVRADPFHHRAQSSLMVGSLLVGDLARARSHATAMRLIFPQDPLPPVTLAWVEQLEGNHPRAVAIVEDLGACQRLPEDQANNMIAVLRLMSDAIQQLDQLNGEGSSRLLAQVKFALTAMNLVGRMKPAFESFGVPALARYFSFAKSIGLACWDHTWGKADKAIARLEDEKKGNPEGIVRYFLAGFRSLRLAKDLSASTDAAVGEEDIRDLLQRFEEIYAEFRDAATAPTMYRALQYESHIYAFLLAGQYLQFKQHLGETDVSAWQTRLTNHRTEILAGFDKYPKSRSNLLPMVVGKLPADLCRPLISQWQLVEPTNVRAVRLRAKLELAALNYHSARRHAEEVLKASPDDSEMQQLLADAREGIQQQAEAAKQTSPET